MRRAGHIMEQVAEMDNLMLAFYKAQRGKVCKREVKDYRARLQENLLALRHELLRGEVREGSYHTFTIYDPKQRQICAAVFGERVLHHALMQVCHEYFERHLIYHTYATRPGKGTYAALEEAHRCAVRYRYVAKLDVRKYFDSIDHAVLKRQLSWLFKDQVLLAVLYRIIDTHETTPDRGLPIGNLTSQYFANHYLSGLDHYVKERLRVEGYVRYMDDMLLFGNDRATLEGQVHAVERYVADRLLLALKPPLVVATSQGVSFLGYRLQGHRIGLNCRSRNRFAHKMGVYGRLLDEGLWNGTEYRDHIVPLLAFAQHGYTRRYRQRITEKVESRRAPTVCCAVVAGTTTPGTAACRIATTTTRRTATTTTGSAWCCPFSSAVAAGGGMVNRFSSCFRHGRNETSGLAPHRGTTAVARQQSASRSLSPFCATIGIDCQNTMPIYRQKTNTKQI